MVDQCPYCGGGDFEYLMILNIDVKLVEKYFQTQIIVMMIQMKIQGRFNSDSSFIDAADYEGYDEYFDDLGFDNEYE